MKALHVRATTGIVLLLIACSVFVFLYFPLIGNWFRSDDTYLMWASASLKPQEMFFNPERHRLLSSNFNPMYGLSFKVDWLMFRMNAVGYAIHCILSLLAASTALYLFIRLYAERKPALVGVLLFLFNPVTFQMAGLFFRRHYTEGLFWSLLGLYFFVRADRRGKISIGAGICYLIASLYREVYVVLPAIAFLISGQNTILKRIRSTIPLWSGLFIYALWRLWLREGMGGYPSNQPFFSVANLEFVPKIFYYLSLQWSHDLPFLMYLLLSILIISSLRHLRLLLCFLVLVVPIMPVSNIIAGNPLEIKYFFHITVFLVVCVSLLINKPPTRNSMLFRSVLISLCLLLVVLFVKNDIRLRDDMLAESIAAKRTATEFMHSGKPYIRPEQPSWFYEGLRYLNKDFLGNNIRTQLVPPDNLLKYSDMAKLKEIEASGIDIPFNGIARKQVDFRNSPITVRMTMDNYRLSWEFGPYKDKNYTLLRSPVSGLYYNTSELRSTGTYMLAKGNADNAPGIAYIRVLYRSGGGEEVISPEFELRIPGSQKIDFFR